MTNTMYSEFAGRHALYERNYAGSQEQQRLDPYNWSVAPGDMARYTELVDQCLGDYDLAGWVDFGGSGQPVTEYPGRAPTST